MTVSIRTRLQSDTIHLPGAAPLIGKDVRIIVVEEPSEQPVADLSALDRIAGKLDLDDAAITDLRRRSVA